MHIDSVPNRDSRPTHLLRESYREDGRVRKRTLANLSALSDTQIEALRAVLRGEVLRPVDALFEQTASLSHGHVQAVSVAMQRLGFDQLLASRPCAERNIVCAMVASRILAPDTKLATSRWWHTTTLAAEFDVVDANEDNLYAAMDWLLERQTSIEKKLCARHLRPDDLVFYDLSSSYFEGTTCPLAKRGYSRDNKRGSLQVNYGLLTDARGCPVAISVYDGNTSDSTTFIPAVTRLRDDFGLERMVMVGDRGMISQKAIDALRVMNAEGVSAEAAATPSPSPSATATPTAGATKPEPLASHAIDWITALKHVSIKALVEQGQLQLGLFDERNIFEFDSPDYPDERLIACRNADLAKSRAYTREDLLLATEVVLNKIKASVAAGKLVGADAIGVRVGKDVNKYKVAKHFELTIEATSFSFTRKVDSIAAEAALDGFYIIRTSVKAAKMDAAQCVRSYKSLSNVERAFRSLKTVDLQIRPIHHRTADRVRAHILLCMLAYYVEWHMRQAWGELLFADTDVEQKQTRDPVAPAQRSEAAKTKVAKRTLDDGSPVHCFRTLLAELSNITKSRYKTKDSIATAPSFEMTTTPNPKQANALALIKAIQFNCSQ